MSFTVLFIFGFVSIFGLIRVGPVLTIVGAEFGFDLAGVGIIQTAFTAAGIILAFPGAWIMRNFGIKRTTIIACLLSLLGAAQGIWATGGPEAILFSRVLEGIGAGFIMIIGPNVCTRIFPQARQGIAMAIWSLWAPAGVFLSLFLAPYLNEFFGWRSLWVVSAVAYAVCLVLALAFFKLPKTNENELALEQAQKQDSATVKPDVRSAVVMALSFIFWCFCFGGCVNSFYSTFLVEAKGLSVYDAGFLPSLISLFTLPLGIIAGVISDKVGTRKWFVVIPYFVLAIVMAFCAWIEGPEMESVYIFIIIMSLLSATIPMGTRAAVPQYAKDPRLTDYALAAMGFVTNIGIGCAVVFGSVVAAIGWQNAGLYLVAPAALLAGVITLAFCKNDLVKKNAKGAAGDAGNAAKK
jgi:MFS family permease